MIDIEGDLEGFIEVNTTTMWDSQLNNGSGANKVIVSVQPGWQMKQMQMDLVELKNQIIQLHAKQSKEELLREANPGLRDAYEKYQTIYKLVENTVNALDNNGE